MTRLESGSDCPPAEGDTGRMLSVSLSGSVSQPCSSTPDPNDELVVKPLLKPDDCSFEPGVLEQEDNFHSAGPTHTVQHTVSE